MVNVSISLMETLLKMTIPDKNLDIQFVPFHSCQFFNYFI